MTARQRARVLNRIADGIERRGARIAVRVPPHVTGALALVQCDNMLSVYGLKDGTGVALLTVIPGKQIARAFGDFKPHLHPH